MLNMLMKIFSHVTEIFQPHLLNFTEIFQLTQKFNYNQQKNRRAINFRLLISISEIKFISVTEIFQSHILYNI